MDNSISLSSHDPSIRDLITATIGDPENYISEGEAAKAYRFSKSIPSLEDFVLRVDKSELDTQRLKALLTSSTALTPVDYLISDLNIGQPLLALGEHITIHRKQAGNALSAEFRALKQEYAAAVDSETEAAIAVMKKILALRSAPDASNPFLPLLERAYQLVSANIKPDFGPGNVLLDETNNTLALVDQLEFWRLSSQFLPYGGIQRRYPVGAVKKHVVCVD